MPPSSAGRVPALAVATDLPRPGLPTSAVGQLRAATRPCHDAVDAAYGGFELADIACYGRFLHAHARATIAAEARLGEDRSLPRWRARAPLLAADLSQLALALPAALQFAAGRGEGWRWGVLYVLEGSRLGGGVLVARAPVGAPADYLSALHLPGEWRTLLRAIDARGSALGKAWVDAAITGARDTFALYRHAALAGG